MDLKKIERISKALGDPYRLRMLEAIKKETGWLQCSKLTGKIDLSQSTVSHHMKQLADAELVIAEKEGRAIRYRVNSGILGDYIDYLNLLR